MPGSVIMGIILLGLGVFVCYEGIDLTLGRPSLPGPGFVPFLLGAILTSLSFFYLRQSLRKKDDGKKTGTPLGFTRLFLAVGVMVLYALVVTWLGYILTTFLLFAIWLSLIERKRWVQTVSLACAAVVAVYFFNTLFSIQLPAGLLKGLIR